MSNKFYKYHNDYDYKTNECRNLKGVIERLIQNGQLLEYVRTENDKQRGNMKEDDRQQEGIEAEILPRRKRV